jgi:dodecin
VRRRRPSRAQRRLNQEAHMTMLKVIEVLAESNKSWEDAAQSAVTQASETLHGIKSLYIKDMEATVDNGKVRSFRINAKISFELDKR